MFVDWLKNILVNHSRSVSRLNIHCILFVILAVNLPDPPFPSAPFPGSLVHRRKKRHVWFLYTCVCGSMSLFCQCVTSVICICFEFSKRQNRSRFTNPYWFFNYPFSVSVARQDMSLDLVLFMKKKQKNKTKMFFSQAPHVPGNVEDETKYIELMVINDHLMVSF